MLNCFKRKIVTLILSSAILAGSQGMVSAQSQKALTKFDPQVRALVSQMTLEEKVGQMCQPDISAVKDPSDIEKLFLGSLLSGGSSDPKDGNSLEAWTRMYEGYQQHALKTRLAIPLIYGIDSVHGNNNLVGATIMPHNIGLGCTRNPKLVEKVARVAAFETRATGIQWAFSPCVTVPLDIRWGRTYEGFSEDPQVVQLLGEAAVRGLQGSRLAEAGSVLACAKHFIGDGGTSYGTSGAGGVLDQGNTLCDEATLRKIHLPGYHTTLKAGVGSIMPSYSSWNGVKCSASKYLMTDLLKKELGFEGFLISDYNAIDQIIPSASKKRAVASNNAAGQVVSPDYKRCIEISINAGMDMVMVTEKYPDFIRGLKELVTEGKVPMSRIDDAVTRILRVKYALGMFDKNARLMGNPALQQKFGSPEHRAIAREAVRQSLVLLKNEHKTLPLAKTARRIHVSGRGADDIGMQCGGWTVDWQGKMGNVITGGTTILTALKNSAPKTTQITFTRDGSGAQGADAGIVVIGEEPYAEMKGDRKELTLSREDLEVVKTMKNAGIPVTVVLLSGRPMILGEVLDQADAVVAAWLPGSEGQGVADVLLGKFKPTGKLSFTWPRAIKPTPSPTGGADYDVLFKVGYGLTY
jgi:beta-glucosidase